MSAPIRYWGCRDGKILVTVGRSDAVREVEVPDKKAAAEIISMLADVLAE